MQRRTLVKAAAALAVAHAMPSAPAMAVEPKTLGGPQPFDFAWLKAQARARAATPYVPNSTPLPAPIQNLTWDQYQAIHFREDHSLWAGTGLHFQIRLFHLGLYFKTPVRMYEVVNGQAREIAYDRAMFDFNRSGVHAQNLPDTLGFAGFRLNFHTDWVRDIAAFLGASYFRAVGGEKQYGQSARGLAINCGLPAPEEFPVFLAFWLERPAADTDVTTIYALLDSPSVAGAYRFVLRPGARFDMDVDASLYLRQRIDRIGIAPLTSMFLNGENDRRIANDWRPEIHDSDGLQLYTGRGEWLWRPLVNPRHLRANSFIDENPRGFGLLQRDRNFDHYQDDGVFYDRRPSVWVQPRSAWGKGAVMLVEIPTIDETFDNIVAFWTPAHAPEAGDQLDIAYTLSWGAGAPVTPPLATVQATRTGIGGIVGQKRAGFSWRFAVDFAGGDLALLSETAHVEPVIEASRGTVELSSARPLTAIRGWRVMFDLRPTDASEEPINLRLYLRSDRQALTETWLYQWTPPPMSERS